MPVENSILASIPTHEKQDLWPKLEAVVLRRPQILCEPDQPLEHAYFPTSGLVSLLSISEAGDASEIMVVTRDGVIGPPILPYTGASPYQIVVRITGRALRIGVSALQDELRILPGLQDALLRHSHEFVRAICTRVACHRAHTPLQRLSGWLLAVRHIVGADHFELTQDAISLSLAIDRSTVTRAALELHDLGALFYRHGRVVIRDRAGLERRACTCERPDGCDSDLPPLRDGRQPSAPRHR